ncbi:MAG: carbon-nitrogen hydrolase family protein [Pseudomonadota bacterium]
MKVAALQTVSGTALQPNLDAAYALLQQAAAQGAELALLPEHFALLGQRDTDKFAIAEAFAPEGGGTIQRFLADAAREFKLWLVGGSIPLLTDDPQKVSNTTLAYSPAGVCVARYDKIHLFHFDNGSERYDEAQVLLPGTAPVAFDMVSRAGEPWRVGLSICYDLRFPELYRALAADLLLVPSAFTFTTGQAHWELLLRARAIENQAYVLAAAQGGEHENGRRTWGHSLLAGPWGEMLAQHADGAAVVLGDCLPARLQQVREQLPALAHRVL